MGICSHEPLGLPSSLTTCYSAAHSLGVPDYSSDWDWRNRQSSLIGQETAIGLGVQGTADLPLGESRHGEHCLYTHLMEPGLHGELMSHHDSLVLTAMHFSKAVILS